MFLAALCDGSRRELFDDLLARGLSCESYEEFGVADVFPAVLVADGGVGRHDVDGGEVVSPADLPVVGVVGRCDFEETRRELRLWICRFLAFSCGHDDVVVLDDRDVPSNEGQSA